MCIVHHSYVEMCGILTQWVRQLCTHGINNKYNFQTAVKSCGNKCARKEKVEEMLHWVIFYNYNFMHGGWGGIRLVGASAGCGLP